MHNADNRILLDILLIAYGACFLAVLVISFSRQRKMGDTLQKRGKVSTHFFDTVDIGVLCIFFTLFFLMVQAGVQQQERAREIHLIDLILSLWSHVFVALTIILILFFKKAALSQVLGLRLLTLKKIIFFSLGGIVVVYILVLVTTAIYHQFFFPDENILNQQESIKALQEGDDLVLKIVLIFSACVLAPITEELLFRGYIYAVLKRYTERVFSALVTSIVFGCIHLHLPSFAPICVLAICFTIAYEITGCLWVPVVMHALFNTINVILAW